MKEEKSKVHQSEGKDAYSLRSFVYQWRIYNTMDSPYNSNSQEE